MLLNAIFIIFVPVYFFAVFFSKSFFLSYFSSCCHHVGPNIVSYCYFLWRHVSAHTPTLMYFVSLAVRHVVESCYVVLFFYFCTLDFSSSPSAYWLRFLSRIVCQARHTLFHIGLRHISLVAVRGSVVEAWSVLHTLGTTCLQRSRHEILSHRPSSEISLARYLWT